MRLVRLEPAATYSQDKIEEIFSQFSFLSHCYIAHTMLYKPVHYRKKSILTMENLHNDKSFNNLCGVLDWLIISGLNAILPRAS